jgi:hypothetical protein
MKDIGNYIVYEDGRVWSKKRNKYQKTHKQNHGYKLIWINNKLKSHHRLLAELFIPNPLNKPQVNHKNGIKDDNRLDNLEWVSASENIQHSFNNGLSKPSVHSNDTKQKMSLSAKGKPKSLAHRKKMSEAAKLAWSKRKS